MVQIVSSDFAEKSPLMDPFGRTISYLRLSVTDRCDFRCVYCMSENMTFLPKKDILTLEEMDRLASAFIQRGVTKLRITGGEPLVRRDIMTLFGSMSRHLRTGALKELTLTTNGTQLDRYADQLAQAGVKRINVSLDTLDADKFARITRWGRLEQVFNGIKAAKNAGLRIKINTVALKGFNEDELETLVDWCGAEGHDLTYIEVMPMGDLGELDRIGQFWSLNDVRARIEKTWQISDTTETTGGPARYVKLAGTEQKIGFITPLSHNFCENCNRVRVTCTGEIYQCLGQENCIDLRAPLRADNTDDALNNAIDKAIGEKPKGHDFDYSGGSSTGQMTRHMSHTGG